MKIDIQQLLRSWVIITIGVLIATHTSSHISYGDNLSTLVVVVLLISALNLLIKPLLIFFALPFVIFSLGIGIWLINAVLFLLVSKIVPGFEVASWGAARWGALIISLMSLIGNALLGGRIKVRTQGLGPSHKKRGPSKNVRTLNSQQKKNLDDDDVIDI